MTSTETTIEVQPDIARMYNTASNDQQQSIQAVLGVLLGGQKRSKNQALEDLKQTMSNISQSLQGTTEEELQNIVDGK